MDATELTPDVLAAFVGGQMEIQNENEGYMCRGEIAEIALEDDSLNVRFAWLAVGVGGPPIPSGWVNNDKPERLDYGASLIIYGVNNIGPSGPEVGGGDRLSMLSPMVGELCVLFPANGSKLDPTKVEGLDLTKV